ncbi:MAG: diguanylate cyclase [Candidatus Marinimicrobia bacterium]|nr:diguanylate cyclase [Candidatus Neomarinimicrobiota bacterium]
MSDPKLNGKHPNDKNSLLSVLVCDSDKATRVRLNEMLSQGQAISFQVREAVDTPQIESALAQQAPDIVILDLDFPGTSAMDWLRKINAREIAPVVIIAAEGNEQMAVDSMKYGAYDYLGKSYLTQDNLVKALTDARKKWIAVQETEQLQAELAHMAMYDALSEVLSRRAILEHIEVEIQRTRRYKRALSLLMVDIDNFKQVNDTYGHLAGDNVIHEIAQSLKLNTRRSDFVGRYGGEEFLVVLPETPHDKARVLAEKLRQQVAKIVVPIDGEVIRDVTISIGLATFKKDVSVESFINRSDEWMYKAKEMGRNQVQPGPTDRH